jgi:hypothetical protein
MSNKSETSVMDRIFGGPVLLTLFRLAMASVVVGLVFAVYGINPMNLWINFGDTIADVWRFVFSAIDWSWQYAALGAIVVLPLWILIRLLSAIGGKPRG